MYGTLGILLVGSVEKTYASTSSLGEEILHLEEQATIQYPHSHENLQLLQRDARRRFKQNRGTKNARAVDAVIDTLTSYFYDRRASSCKELHPHEGNSTYFGEALETKVPNSRTMLFGSYSLLEGLGIPPPLYEVQCAEGRPARYVLQKEFRDGVKTLVNPSSPSWIQFDVDMCEGEELNMRLMGKVELLEMATASLLRR